MSNDRQCTADDIRRLFAAGVYFEYGDVRDGIEFDRWLTAHEKAIRTLALEEAARIAETPRPYGYTAAAAIRASKP